jgi:hypothetical protein
MTALQYRNRGAIATLRRWWRIFVVGFKYGDYPPPESVCYIDGFHRGNPCRICGAIYRIAEAGS